MARHLSPPAAALLVALLLVAVGSAAADPRKRSTPAHARSSKCRVPRLTGLVVVAARERIAKAGCHIRVLGAPLERPDTQTIRRQSARPGQLRHTVTVWVNRLCPGSADAGPPRGEPFLKPGPTELISGLYLDGGPLRLRSAPSCSSISGTSGAGTITVTDPATAAIVATKTVASGQLGVVLLPPGTYTVVGTFANAFANDRHMQSFPKTVTIPAGTTVRQDLEVSIP
jgi:hypothetical protein